MSATRVSPARSCADRSASYLAPTLRANAESAPEPCSAISPATARAASARREVRQRPGARCAHLYQTRVAERGLELSERLTRPEHTASLHQAHEQVLARPGLLDNRRAAQLAAWAQHACHLRDRGRGVGEAVKPGICDAQVEAAV